jgi:hypothetical protein
MLDVSGKCPGGGLISRERQEIANLKLLIANCSIADPKAAVVSKLRPWPLTTNLELLDKMIEGQNHLAA